MLSLGSKFLVGKSKVYFLLSFILSDAHIVSIQLTNDILGQELFVVELSWITG